MKWVKLVKYPNLIKNMDSRVKALLDTMEELVPIEKDRDRLGSYLKWREKCHYLGLIDTSDIHLLNQEMIHGCRGM